MKLFLTQEILEVYFSKGKYLMKYLKEQKEINTKAAYRIFNF
jgi:hypothetical protein